MNTTNTGQKAEKVVAKHLKKQGYRIVTNNWRNRWCEIDLVATKKKIVYFIEVKYRQRSDWGNGLEVITHKKLKQMEFAAQIWVEENKWSGDWRLMVASVAGKPPKIENIVEI